MMTTTQKLIQPKLRLVKLTEKLGNVSEACKVKGYSRDSFDRFQKLYNEGGELALKVIGRTKPLLKNRIEQDIEEAEVADAVALSIVLPESIKDECADDECWAILLEHLFQNHSIKLIDCNEIAPYGGLLNCISWKIIR
jgi:Winged helix-turn helix